MNEGEGGFTPGLGTRKLGLESQICHPLAWLPWANYFPSLGLSVLSYVVGETLLTLGPP